MPSVRDLILQFSQQYRLDPAAVMAVARGEGGLVNRADDIGDLAGGGSYGPFQLYAKGALPAEYRGKPQAADSWAWSPAGIEYATRKMAESGAAGLTGGAAVNSIIRRFERPADPDSSVRNALARLGMSGDMGAQPSAAVQPSPLTREFAAPAAPAQPMPDGRSEFAAGLIGAMRGGKLDPQALLGLVQARRAAQTRQLAAAPGQVTPSVPLASTGGANQPASGTLPQGEDWQKWVGTPERRTGPSKPHQPAILQFVGKIGGLANTVLTPWGNESHSLTTVNGTPSAHATGDAADIPATGDELIRLGQTALVAAGMSPAEARRQKGGLFNVGGAQVIFNTQTGGDHTNHVHVGIRH